MLGWKAQISCKSRWDLTTQLTKLYSNDSKCIPHAQTSTIPTAASDHPMRPMHGSRDRIPGLAFALARPLARAVSSTLPEFERPCSSRSGDMDETLRNTATIRKVFRNQDFLCLRTIKREENKECVSFVFILLGQSQRSQTPYLTPRNP